jgi:hypothetical protein
MEEVKPLLSRIYWDYINLEKARYVSTRTARKYLKSIWDTFHNTTI